jgi:hypothetical protein
LDVAGWQDYCNRVFNHEQPDLDIAFTYSYFGGLDITGDNILFMTASEDPWKYAGMLEIQDPVTQKNMVARNIKCVGCGHCVDLHGPKDDDPQDLKDARQLAYTTIEGWLGLSSEKEDQTK